MDFFRSKWIVIITISILLIIMVKDEIVPKFMITDMKVLQVTLNNSLQLEGTPLSLRTPVRLWIDIPNAFPWRNCLQEYNRVILPLHCQQVITWN